MSIDRPGGGDGFPDRRPEGEDRPFPGAPEYREPVEAPKKTFSMEEISALRSRATSAAEFAAMETTYTPGQVFAQLAESGYPGRESGVPDADGGDRAGGSVEGLGVPTTDPVADEGPGKDDPWAQPVGDARAALDDGVRGDEDGRFAGWPDTETAAAVADGREDPVGGHEADGAHGSFGRTGDLQDQAAAETGEPEGGERPGSETRTSADTSRQGERGEETSGEKNGEGQGEDGQEQKGKDLVQVQHLASETAETDRPSETASEALPDQQSDDPRITAMERQMERMMATVEAMQEKLEASEARHEEAEVGLEQKLGELQAENLELKQKVAEMETGRKESPLAFDRSQDSSDDLEPPEVDGVTEPVTRPDALGAGDEADADTADLAEAVNSEADQEASRLSSKPERSGCSQETVDFWKSAAGVAQAAGFTFPGADLVTGGEATRRAFEKMTPDEQIATMRMGDAAGNAIGGMYPGAALAALGLSIVLPVAQDKFRNMADKLKRRGQDEG